MFCLELDRSINRLLVASPIALVLLFVTLSGTLANVSVHLKSSHEGWINTGLEAAKGDKILVSVEGSLDIGLAAPMEGRQLIWVRFGNDGDVFQLTFNDEIITANNVGLLHVAFLNPPNVVLGNRKGKLNSSYKMIPETDLDFKVFAAKLGGFRPDQTKFAKSLAKAERNAELVKSLPSGFDHLWYLGASNIFASKQTSRGPGVFVKTNDDGGIIKKDLDIPLTKTTEIDFSWLYRKLPATAPETTLPAHDYMSIAIEFDNGQDITWYWSHSLAPETFYRCPLAGWDKVETHIVVQSGQDGLGEWHEHKRNIFTDYSTSVGGEMPKKIVGVWFIGNSMFGRRGADAEFANISVQDGNTQISIFDTDAN
ncbi:MAG TPA: hypothetical protein DCP14_02820 [Rhodobiaceae bacterium]|nr:hypothetical protein [Rhodobiaceae bacterium]